MFKAFMRQLSQ
jgi:hypothetical protein